MTTTLAYDFTVPANTSRDTPATLDIPLTKGTLAGVSIWFQAGCAGYVYARIREGDHLISPEFQGQAWHFDNYVLDLDLNYEIVQPPYVLTLEGWSPGSLFSHTLITRWTLERSADLSAEGLLSGLFGRGA